MTATTRRHAGAWITFVGIDGSGKSTQANLLQRRLTDEGYLCYAPEGQDQFAATVLRSLAARVDLPSARSLVPPMVVELLSAMDLLRDVCQRVLPLCANGAIVVQSHSTHRRLAAALTRGCEDMSLVESIVHYAGQPDLTFWLDVAVDQAMERIACRGKDREDPALLETFRLAHEHLAKTYDWRRVTDGDVEQVHQMIWRQTQVWLLTRPELVRARSEF